MVENGTAFLVIRLESQEGFTFFLSLLGAHEEEKQEFAEEFTERNVGFPCFLKVKNYLGSNEPLLGYFYKSRKNPHALDVREAYRIEPRLVDNAIVILTSNMGTPIRNDNCKARNMGWDAFCQEFLNLMTRTVELEEKRGLNHGDIHVDNLVYGDRLSLIDFDEGRVHRVTVRKPQRRIHVAGLRATPIVFTKNQLVNLFCDCWDLGCCPRPTLDASSIKRFVEGYQGLFHDGQSPDAQKASDCYDALLHLLDEIVSAEGIEVAYSQQQEGDQSDSF